MMSLREKSADTSSIFFLRSFLILGSIKVNFYLAWSNETPKVARNFLSSFCPGSFHKNILDTT